CRCVRGRGFDSRRLHFCCKATSFGGNRKAVVRYDSPVSTRIRTYAQWRADRETNAAWIGRVDRALPAYERRRPRDAKEAELLRQRGTPERLMGPSRPA